jgi:hypothetical protein
MSNNISWSANANYEQLSDSHVKKESKTTKTKSKKDDKVDNFIEVDIKLLEKVISNFEESYKTKPDKKVYDGLVMLESILTNLN